MTDPHPSPQEQTQQNPISTAKDWMTFIIAVIAAISGIIFWVQSVGKVEYQRIEKDVAEIKVEMKEIHQQNGEILRLIGQLEGKVEGLK
jgi:cell division protein FtsB